MRQTGFHSDLTAVLVLTAGQWLWWLDADVPIVLKIVPSMLRLWRQAFAILHLYVFSSLASSLSILLINFRWHDSSICHKNGWKAPKCFGSEQRVLALHRSRMSSPHIHPKSYLYEGKHQKCSQINVQQKDSFYPNHAFSWYTLQLRQSGYQLLFP